jgi:hypothetical protein
VTLLEAIRNEERKLAMEVNKVQRELNGIRAAAKSLGGSARKIAKNKLSKHATSSLSTATVVSACDRSV